MTTSGKEFINNFRNARLNPFSDSSSPSLITRGDIQKAARNKKSSSFVDNLRNSIPNNQNEEYVPKAPSFRYTAPEASENIEVTISKSPEYSFRAASKNSIADLQNRQSQDKNASMPNSRYYRYIPFSFEDEVGTQYGLIQTPSFATNEITGVFLDNGFSFGPEDAMNFISSAKNSIFVPPTNNYSYQVFREYGDDRSAPAAWLQDMRKRYLKNNPDSAYSQRTIDSINRYEQTGRF